MFCIASVYAFGKLQRSSPGQQTSPCSVCVTTGSNFLCGVDLTSNTARTLHDSDQEVVQLELRWEYIDLSSACGTGGTEESMLWTSPLSCSAVSNTSTVLSLELPSVVSSLYTSKSARSVTSTTVSLLWSDNSCAWFAVAATLTILPDTSVSSRFSFWMLAAHTSVGW